MSSIDFADIDYLAYSAKKTKVIKNMPIKTGAFFCFESQRL